MRALVDANIFVSYLLNPHGNTTSGLIVTTMLAGHPEMEFLVSETSLREVKDAIKRKPYLTARIPSAMVERFMTSLARTIQIVPALPEPISPISRDPGDDFVIALAIFHDVEIIVSGDKDLLVLNPIG